MLAQKKLAQIRPAKERLTQADKKLFEFFQKHLYVAVICDILDSLGFRNQAMHRRLRPLLTDIHNCGFVGRAKTVQWMSLHQIVENDPYGLEIEALDSIKPGDVLIHSTDLTCDCAPWGELLTTVAKRNGAVGCVCDNGIRDCRQLIQMNFPVYYAAITPFDSKGRARVMALDVPVRCGEVLVKSGELVFADYDGIVVIPKEVEQDTLKLATEKVDGESLTRKALLEGKTLREVFDTYHIL